jgi:hypothetical protein
MESAFSQLVTFLGVTHSFMSYEEFYLHLHASLSATVVPATHLPFPSTGLLNYCGVAFDALCCLMAVNWNCIISFS